MKHSLKITLLLILIFILAQLAGLIVINEYIDVKASSTLGVTTLNNETYGITGIQPPQVENESNTFIFILIAVLIGTGLVLLIIKFRKRRLWKFWFFLSVTMCLALAFAPFILKILKAFIPGLLNYAYIITFGLAVLFGVYKVFKPNIFVHNFTEIFIYGGLASLIVPIINLFSVFMLLVFISLYDAYAVWKSKHMVKMAKFQTKEKLFAGFYIPYSFKGMKKPKNTKSMKKRLVKVRSAVLGGGDVAFPLLFSGVVMKTTGSYVFPLIITLTTAIALGLLLTYSEKGKFYPAMPFISAGCFVGYLVCMLI